MNTIIINYKAPPRRRGAGPRARGAAAGHARGGEGPALLGPARMPVCARTCTNNETTASPPEAHNPEVLKIDLECSKRMSYSTLLKNPEMQIVP